jgi:hypothetical protein
MAKTAVVSGAPPALSRRDAPPYPPMSARADKAALYPSGFLPPRRTTRTQRRNTGATNGPASVCGVDQIDIDRIKFPHVSPYHEVTMVDEISEMGIT